MRQQKKESRRFLAESAPLCLGAMLVLPLALRAGNMRHFAEIGILAGASVLLLRTRLFRLSPRLEDDFLEFTRQLNAIIWEADARTLHFTSVRGRVKELLGYPVERWLGDPGFFSLHIHPDDRERVLEAVQSAVSDDEEGELKYRAESSEGKSVWVLNRFQVGRDSSGQARRLAGLITLVTTVEGVGSANGCGDGCGDGPQHIEQLLRQAQKMEALGRLAGGVAHDFNNILTVVGGYSGLLLAGLAEGHPLRKHVEEIKTAGERGAALTRQLLAFSRRQTVEPKVVDLNAVVTNVEKMLRRLIGEDIELITVRKPGLGKVKADVGQLEQVLMNLAVNARDAMPAGGKLILETSDLDLDESSLGLHGGLRPGRYVRLAVSDTGCGMDPATQQHIFEPFFTTKEKGTGLGLATVYGIVKQSGGLIGVYSEVGCGTTFRICLPQAEEEMPVPALEPHRGSRREPRGSETVLVVEDEGTVRSLVSGVLQHYGYDVLQASQGDEALRLARRHQGAIHLMLTDLVMPRMNGRELAERLTSARPETRVLYMSGYTEQTVVRQSAIRPSDPFLEKPFHPVILARKVREVLDAPSTLMMPPAEAFASAREALA